MVRLISVFGGNLEHSTSRIDSTVQYLEPRHFSSSGYDSQPSSNFVVPQQWYTESLRSRLGGGTTYVSSPPQGLLLDRLRLSTPTLTVAPGLQATSRH